MPVIRTIDELKKYIKIGRSFDYLYFWGHRQKSSTRITKSCLSNWYSTRFNVHGFTYTTSEQYMMAQKALLFDDQIMYEAILKSETPRESQQLGRKVHCFDQSTWSRKRFDIVVEANFQKFSQNDLLADFLIQTGSKILVEASPDDKIWGIGMSESDTRAGDPNHWGGLNLLGFALMGVRAKLLTQ
ncbi:MAG: NADAR family protein [Candidatus Thiodiazotropha sp.]